MKTPQLTVLASVYKGETYLETYFEQLEGQSIFPEMEIVFVANAPSPQEQSLLAAFKQRYPQQVKIIEVPRESLGASWNRAWQAARAPLLAMWNIDDRRQPDSLQRQVSAINHHGWALSYGDYISVAAYGEEQGTRRTTPHYSAAHFARAFAQGGAFWVLRKDLAARIGYFDEQFRTAADMDYSFRIAANKLPMGRVDGILGYFTDAEQGLSTREGGQEAAIERAAVQLRYGVFDKVQPSMQPAAKQFRLDHVQSFGEWQPMAEIVPSYASFLRWRKPLWVLGIIRRAARNILARLGLLHILHGKLRHEI